MNYKNPYFWCLLFLGLSVVVVVSKDRPVHKIRRAVSPVFFQDRLFTAQNEKSYVVNKTIIQVRRSLAGSDTTQKIIEKNGATLISNQLQRRQVNVRRDWDFASEGILTVQASSPYIGSMTLQLNQEFFMNKEKLLIHAKLKEPVDILQDYEVTTTMQSQGSQTVISHNLKIVIKENVPDFAVEYCQEEVTKSVTQGLEKSEASFRSLIER